MKNFLIFIACIVITAGLWNDLTNGSLPQASGMQKSAVPIKEQALPSLPYEVREVQSGDTVLSVLSALHDGRLPTDIETAVTAFQQLNEGVSPDAIQPGETYKFPLYTK